ncbi:MAG: hypothetical protein Q8M65_12230, partial [Rhodoglobus sp.]|nr:hypothetical protein [Rhodoglobus sp.]
FFDRFDATAIVATDVPALSTMTVRYWTGTAWVDVPGAVGIVGPASLSVALPAGVRGLEFEFTPTNAASELPPGFNVQPNVRTVLRSTLRGTSNPAVDPAGPDPVVVNNTVVSEVTNPVASPSFATDSAVDSITVLTGNTGGGTGIGAIANLIEKDWYDTEVLARSNASARLAVKWGTGGVAVHSAVISDTAVDPASGGWSVANSVFEAFDLLSIPAITTTMDPLLRYDAIQSVQLYRSSGWTATTTNPCAGTACYGTFPGYVLTVAERADTIGVRFVVVENPQRPNPTSSNPSAPAKGSGIAPSVSTGRTIDLIFGVRDTRRSNGQAVLGLTRETIYNTGEFGQVLNDTRIALFDSASAQLGDDTASDTILILDRPITVQATKVWSGGPLGVPPLGTDAQYFPSARMVLTARNTSLAKVDELSLSEPTNGTRPFDFVNLSDIVSITVPSG